MKPGIFLFMPAVYLAALFAVLCIGFSYAFDFRSVVAMHGNPVLEAMVRQALPTSFAHDFSADMDAPAPVLAYLLQPLQWLTRIPGITLLMGVMWLEMAAMIAAAWIMWRWLVRACLPEEVNRPVMLWAFAWLGAIVLAQHGANEAFAFFSLPRFDGSGAGFADALGIAAVAFAFSKRWPEAALAIAVMFIMAPGKGMAAGVFIAACMLIDGRRSIGVRACLHVGAALILCGAWAYWRLGVGAADTGEAVVEPYDFIAFSRLFDPFLYPVEAGAFGAAYGVSVAPFLALTGVGFLALVQCGLAPAARRQVLAGYGVLAAAVIAGLWIAANSLTPGLIAAQMATMAARMMTLLAPFFIMGAAVVHWRHRVWGWAVAYIVFLLSVFFDATLMAPGFAAMMIAVHVLMRRAEGVLFSDHDRVMDGALILASAGLVVAASLLWLHAPEVLNPLTITLGRVAATAVAVAGFCAIAPAPRWVRLGLPPEGGRIAAVSALVYICVFIWGHHASQLNERFKDEADAYYRTQIWAKNNTSPGALFMIDPCAGTGWRDFSERASLGIPREWYMDAWAYSRKQAILDKGLSVGKTLGLEMEPALAGRGVALKTSEGNVCGLAQKLFYDPTRAAVKRMVKAYGVDYVVMRTPMAVPIARTTTVLPLYQNPAFAVYEAKDLME